MNSVCFCGSQKVLNSGAARRPVRVDAAKFDPDLMKSAKQGGRRRKGSQDGDKFEGLEQDKMYRGPKSMHFDEEVWYILYGIKCLLDWFVNIQLKVLEWMGE